MQSQNSWGKFRFINTLSRSPVYSNVYKRVAVNNPGLFVSLRTYFIVSNVLLYRNSGVEDVLLPHNCSA